MDKYGKERKSRTSIWLIFGVIVLIIILLLWLTEAFSMGDTDVAACISLL